MLPLYQLLIQDESTTIRTHPDDKHEQSHVEGDDYTGYKTF